MPSNFLPSDDASLLAWEANFDAIAQAGYAAIGLSEPQSSDFHDTFLAYQSALTAAQHANTRTRPAIEAKNTAKVNLAAFARKLVAVVQTYGPLTDAQRRSLRITVRKQRSPIPAPSTRPAVRLESMVVRTMTVSVYDAASATKRNRPALTAGAKLYTFVGASYPSDPTLWAYQGDFTKTKCEIVFPDGVAGGAQVWVCAAWYNAKGETGPTSVPISTNVQGGGTGEVVAMKIAA